MGLTEYGHIATEETQLRVADLLQAIAAGSAGPEYTDATFKALLDDIHVSMFNRALAHRESHTQEVRDFGDFMEAVQTGFAKAPWCGERECEDEIKAITGATTRCYTLDYDPEAHGDTCIFCGKKAKHLMYFGKAY